MAKTQEKQAFITETSPIIMEHVHDHEEEGIDTNDYEQDGFGSGCFRFFCFGNQSSVEGEGDRTKFLQQTGDHPHKETWLIKKLKVLKEYSELVAGPKWKNFIRKFSKKPKTKNTQFQYDPQSYALNFNDGGCDDEDDGFLARNFSTRFAPPSSSDQQRRPATL